MIHEIHEGMPDSAVLAWAKQIPNPAVGPVRDYSSVKLGCWAVFQITLRCSNGLLKIASKYGWVILDLGFRAFAALHAPHIRGYIG